MVETKLTFSLLTGRRILINVTQIICVWVTRQMRADKTTMDKSAPTKSRSLKSINSRRQNCDKHRHDYAEKGGRLGN